MSHLSQRTLLAALCSVCILSMTGCGIFGDSPSCAPGTLSSQSSGANFSLVPTDYDISIYPGGTVQIPMLIEPIGDASGQVTIQPATLPSGMTMDEVTGNIGSTVNVTLHAALNVAANCFQATAFSYEASQSVAVRATGSSGSYLEQLPVNVTLENPDYVPTTSSGLPVLAITTDGGAAVTSEDDYVDATLTVTDTANPAYNYTGTMGIKGHGNSTWKMPKKPYRLNLDSKTPLLGMTSDSNWILLANYDDKAMIRNDVSFHLSNLFGMFWTPNSVFADVYLNGQYEGVYQVTEKVEVSKARLNIGSIDDTDNSGTNLTGGYLGQIDHYDGETLMITSQVGLPIGLSDPDPPTTEQAAYFTTAFQTAESSLYAANFTDATAGWRANWDQDAFVQWFLVNEFMGNQDADDFSSDYFYKPRSDGRFYMGPVWDMDITAGNVNYSAIVSPTVPWVATQSKWYSQLLKDPTFQAAVKTKWTTMRSQVGDLPTYIDQRAAALTPAANNNYGRWPTLGELVVPNSEAAGSYNGEITFLKNWLTQRMTYMDNNYLQK